METRNFYVVLGVAPSETSTGIRHAFRELAYHYHPDRAGSQGMPFFKEIVEAYRVLSDPRSRSSYDAGLRDAGETGTARRAPITPSPWPQAEPLAPTRLSLFHDFAVTRPSFEEVFERIVRSFNAPDFPKSQRLEALQLQILLPPDAAARGGVLDLGVPVFYPCRGCHGSGSSGAFGCVACGGSGMIQEEEDVRIPIPAGVRDGAVLRLPLRALGIHNLALQLLLRVGRPRPLHS